MATALSYFGTAVFAASGALRAGERRLDLFGVLVIAAITAIGGGTVRDLLLGAGAVGWVDAPAPLLVALGAGLVTFVVVPHRLGDGRAFLVADAIGLATFAVLGANVAHDAGASTVATIVLASITAVAGGVIRDVLCGSVPLVLREDIYASAALAGGAAYLALLELGVGTDGALLGGGGLALAARLLAIRYGLRLPTMAAARGTT